MNKEIIKLGVTLMIITILASLALSLTNKITKEKIEEQKDIQLIMSLAEVLPQADDFKEADEYYDAYLNGEIIGRVLKVNSQGYSSVIKMLVGVNLENKITGIVALDQLETPGLGANIEKRDFLDQFIGKGEEQLKVKQDGGEIDAITGATISSRAVTQGIAEMMAMCPCDGTTGASPAKPEEQVGNIEEVGNIFEEENIPSGAAVYIDYLNKKLAENE